MIPSHRSLQNPQGRILQVVTPSSTNYIAHPLGALIVDALRMRCTTCLVNASRDHLRHMKPKFPAFQQDNIAEWLNSVQFLAARSTFPDQQVMFNDLLLALPVHLHEYVSADTMAGAERLFDAAIDRLRALFGKSYRERMKEFLAISTPMIRPSQLYVTMHQKGREFLNDHAITSMWLEKLPPSVRGFAAIFRTEHEMLEAADKAYIALKDTVPAANVDRPTTSYTPRDPTRGRPRDRRASTPDQERQTSKSRERTQRSPSPGRPRQRNFSASPQRRRNWHRSPTPARLSEKPTIRFRSTSAERNNEFEPKICKNHIRYGKDCNVCLPPCDYPRQPEQTGALTQGEVTTKPSRMIVKANDIPFLIDTGAPHSILPRKWMEKFTTYMSPETVRVHGISGKEIKVNGCINTTLNIGFSRPMRARLFVAEIHIALLGIDFLIDNGLGLDFQANTLFSSDLNERIPTLPTLPNEDLFEDVTATLVERRNSREC